MSRFDTEFNSRVMAGSERAFGVSVTATRGVLVTAAFTARRDDIDPSSFGAEAGSAGKILARVYWLPVASYILDSELCQPRAGDVITDGDDEWRVFAPDDATPASQPVPGGHDWMTYARKVP